MHECTECGSKVSSEGWKNACGWHWCEYCEGNEYHVNYEWIEKE